jgi:cytochrome c oxidase subunit 3
MQSIKSVSSGMLALLAAVTMLFSAFTSAGLVRRGLSNDWVAVPLPAALWISLALFIASNVVLEFTRIRPRLLYAAVFLGLASLARIPSAWQSGAGFANPSIAFLYVITASFAVCALGGIIGLVRAPASPGAVLYWRFLGGLWIYLMLLLYTWN